MPTKTVLLPPVRPLALTVPERIAASQAQLDLTGDGRYVPLNGLPRMSTPILVAPVEPVWNQWPPTATKATKAAARTALKASGRPVSLRLHGRTVPAVVVELGLRKARVELLHRRLDVGWYLAGGPPQVLTVDGPSRHDDHLLTRGPGSTLAAALSGVQAPTWNTAAQPGWVTGGSLGICCETCSRPLDWRDWWHADATSSLNTAFVFCPRHGGPVHQHRGLPIAPLVAARRQLDATLVSAPAGARSVYVLEVVGKSADAVYVGETCKPQVVRRKEHEGGGPLAARVFKQEGVSVGALRPDLLPEAFTELGPTQSTCAEQWTAVLLRHHGREVYGGH